MQLLPEKEEQRPSFDLSYAYEGDCFTRRLSPNGGVQEIKSWRQ